MDILLNEEERMVKASAREFLEVECPPTLVRDMEVDERGYSPDMWRKVVNLGWLGLALPEKYGGQGLPITYLGIIMEEMGRYLAPLPIHSTMVAALTVANDGTEEQRQEVLPSVANGDSIMTWAFTEQNPRFVPEAINAQATADGDGFVINGTKLFVDNFVVADKCLVVCRTAPASSGNEGISVFLMDTNSPGISQISLVTMAKDKQSEVTFDNVRVPKANMIGALNQGWPIVHGMLDRATVLLCTQLVGATRMDAEMAIEYSKNRTAFGRPIGAFQSVSHMCADMIMWVDGGQLLTYEALWKLDQGLPASVEISQAKAFSNEKCEAVVRYGQMIHGGIGFMMEFNLHLWFRRVSAWTMKLGTTFEHRAKIANALLNHPGKVELGRPVVAGS
jgi:alkylation response protein AidB-like acyl-CoA dehydrogenase